MWIGGGVGPSPPRQCPRPPLQSLVLERKAVPVAIRGTLGRRGLRPRPPVRHAHLGARRRLPGGLEVGEAPGVSVGAGTTVGGGAKLVAGEGKGTEAEVWEAATEKAEEEVWEEMVGSEKEEVTGTTHGPGQLGTKEA